MRAARRSRCCTGARRCASRCSSKGSVRGASPASVLDGQERARRRPHRRSPPASGSRVELARAAGLEVGRGIVVDDELRTSEPRRLCGRRVRRAPRQVLWPRRAALRARTGDSRMPLHDDERQAVHRDRSVYSKLKVAGVEPAIGRPLHAFGRRARERGATASRTRSAGALPQGADRGRGGGRRDPDGPSKMVLGS